MTAQQLAEALENIFQEENDRLLNSVRALQAEAVRELSRLIERPRAGLITDDNGKVIVSGKGGAENRARIGRIKAILKTFIQGARGKPGKLDKAKESYLNAFKAIEEVQARYFKENFKSFEVRPLKALTKAAQFRTAELLSTGLTQELTTPLYLILDQALRGASLKEINERAREELETTFSSGGGGRRQEVKSRGRLESYANRIVRDTLNNFSGNLTTATAESLGLEWFYYSAGKVQGSRPFCLEREGKYFHREEVERWAALSWEGKNPQTNEDNILALRGGYNCMHSIIPVSKDAIPENREPVVKPPAESGREAPEQAQESQAFTLPKTPEEAIKRGKKTLEEAKKIINKYDDKIENKYREIIEIQKESDQIESFRENIIEKLNNASSFEEQEFFLSKLNKFRNKQLELYKKEQKIRNEIIPKIEASISGQIQALFLSDKGANMKFRWYGRKSETATPANFKKWQKEFTRFLGPSFSFDNNEIRVNKIGARREYAFLDPRTLKSNIAISGKTPKATFMHELGHAVEYQNLEFNKLVIDFFHKRTKGENLESLKKLTGLNYGEHEKAYKDEFLNPYMGKRYNSKENGVQAGEIFTMFLTYLYQPLNLLEMIDKDPEYFQFFAGIFGNQ